MKTAGIVAEYNPFHNGHKYHIEQTKKLTGAKGIIVVMSGSFVQRGEYALCDKWSRAKMALLNGADLVVELPCVYSCQSAEYFAKGAVSILENLKCNFLSFGTEAEDIEEIRRTAEFLINPDENFNRTLEVGIKSGVSYPKALSNAMITDTLNTPNNVLGVEYIKHIKNMEPVAIKRQGSIHDGKGSASDIRKKLLSTDCIDNLIPVETAEILKTAQYADPRLYEALILYKLRTITAEQLKNVPYVKEGLENRILQCAHKCTSLDDLLDSVKTKRYTMARIRRILLNALLDITKEDIVKSPEYIKVLGMSSRGKDILSRLRKSTDIPIITKVAKAPPSPMLEKDINATNIYSVLAGNPSMLDYKNSPIIIQKAVSN